MSRALGLFVSSACASPVKGFKASIVAAKDAEMPSRAQPNE